MDHIVAKRDIGLVAFIIAICIAVLYETWDLPPGTFEPLGSGPVPQATAFIVIGICLVILARAFIRLRRHEVAVERTAEELALEAEEKASGFYPRPKAAVAVMVFACLYVGALYLGVIGFGTVTVAFLLATILFLLGPAPLRAGLDFIRTGDRGRLAEAKPLLVGLIIAVVMGYGCEIIFTQIFYVDLPTG